MRAMPSIDLSFFGALGVVGRDSIFEAESRKIGRISHVFWG